MGAHLSALVAITGLPFGHVLGPLLVYLIKGNQSEYVASHAKASLNYQITVSVLLIVGILVAAAATLAFVASGMAANADNVNGIGIGLLWLVVGIAVVLGLLLSIIFIIAGTLAASEGRPYNYPFAIRFLR